MMSEKPGNSLTRLIVALVAQEGVGFDRASNYWRVGKYIFLINKMSPVAIKHYDITNRIRPVGVLTVAT